MTLRPRRSVLYMPASNQKAIDKARTLPCDAVILDLEDAVAPDAKDLAREQAVAAVKAGGFGQREVILRVNGLETPWGAADLAAAAAGPDGILVPKINNGGDVARYNNHIDHAPAHTRLWAMIETGRVLFHLEGVAQAAEMSRLACWVMGTNDLVKETGARLTTTREALWAPLSLSVAAARAYGLAILDGVFNGLEDPEGFEAGVRLRREDPDPSQPGGDRQPRLRPHRRRGDLRPGCHHRLRPAGERRQGCHPRGGQDGRAAAPGPGGEDRGRGRGDRRRRLSASVGS